MNNAVAKPVKKRDPEATKAKLLEAARTAFTDKGYEAAGLREICRNAGVDQALVKRYFGSKEGLFREMFLSSPWMNDLMSHPKEELGARIAGYWVNKQIDSSGFDATMALLRSVGSRQVNQQLRDVVEQQYVDRLAQRIGGIDAPQRAALIISQIIGFDVSRRILGIESMSVNHQSKLAALWSVQIQALVDGNSGANND